MNTAYLPIHNILMEKNMVAHSRLSVFILAALLIPTCVLLIPACSSSSGIPVSYRFLEKKSYDAMTDIYKYEYAIEGDELAPIEIFVKQDGEVYLITLENYAKNMKNTFVYNTLTHPTNFISEYRSEKAFVSSLKEANEKALLWFIEDVKAKEKAAAADENK